MGLCENITDLTRLGLVEVPLGLNQVTLTTLFDFQVLSQKLSQDLFILGLVLVTKLRLFYLSCLCLGKSHLVQVQTPFWSLAKTSPSLEETNLITDLTIYCTWNSSHTPSITFQDGLSAFGLLNSLQAKSFSHSNFNFKTFSDLGWFLLVWFCQRISRFNFK